MAAIRAEERLALAWMRPAALGKVTGPDDGDWNAVKNGATTARPHARDIRARLTTTAAQPCRRLPAL
jgi:hypothetical protein